MNATAPVAEHAALMDSIYCRQRHIYDLTRKYYLFGRDTLIRGLQCEPGMRVLEIGCGTGRNLARIARTWPGVTLHGLDISAEMLDSARKALGPHARLALGDATGFDPEALFGTQQFDRIVIPFALSMIPQWQSAIAHAASLLEPGGSLHMVDFGDLGGLPHPARTLLSAWLRKFHVTPRRDLVMHAAGISYRLRLEITAQRGALGYYSIVILRRPRASLNLTI